MDFEQFGTLNAPFVQEMFEDYLRDPESVDPSWRALFENGLRGLLRPSEAERAAARADVRSDRAARTESVGADRTQVGERVVPLRGAAQRIVENMTESLAVPTATSYREIAVTALDARRRALNAALRRRADERKVSYTHLIAYALVGAARAHAVMTHAFRTIDGTPHRVDPGGVHLGIAVDVERKDGSRGLVVPVIHHAERMPFAEFLAAYDDLVDGARRGKLLPDAYRGATITLTNPGTIGTRASVPRLMAGQGTIVATGAIGYPAEFAHLQGQTLTDLGIAKVMTVSSTYDHRIIQGAESGLFLKRVEELLQGVDDFYGGVFRSLGVAEREGVEAGEVQPPGRAEATGAAAAAPVAPGVDLEHVAASVRLLRAYRNFGHRAARLDPLGSAPPGDPALDPEPLGLTPDVLAAIPARVWRAYVPGETAAEALSHIQETYCGTMAYEVEHIADHAERVWLREMIEGGRHRRPLDAEARRRLLARLVDVEALETFLHRQYLGHKRFGIEGLDMLVPMLELAIELAAEAGAREVVMGMAHRGRLNVLAHVVGLPYETILAEFEGGRQVEEVVAPEGGTGDVKYHHGAEGAYHTAGGRTVTVALAANPSHLEAVNPVVVGRARAEQTNRKGRDATRDESAALAILVHGDAAFAAQGVVAETFNLERLTGYRTGGTLHIIGNNQIGFTTPPSEARSTECASDLAKGFDVPIIHVNADDPEACLAAVGLAMTYRERFHGDALIDLVGYRRHGHNEGDEPSYTQPSMYERIQQLPPVRARYAERLIENGVVTAEEVEQLEQEAYNRLVRVQDALKASRSAGPAREPQRITGEYQSVDEPETAVPGELLHVLNTQLLETPAGFTVHPKLARQLERRRTALDDDSGMDWAHGEALALASLVCEGHPVRLVGQDTVRGTFSQRHLALFDVATGESYMPMQHLPGSRAPFEAYNSPLSEFAALGFEYGYSVAAPDVLVLWEAQFGDFVNAAEVVIDQFIIAGLAKWGQTARLTLLLPHGYEGQGPEHSSARVERFLALGAEGNIRIANCTTPGQYFHLLRRQAKHPLIRPLVLFTPKSLLRHPRATSPLADLTSGGFRPVLDDPVVTDREKVTRLALCSGKVYYDLIGAERRAAATHVALGRLELLYPFPVSEVRDLIGRYPALDEVLWVQEEPSNMGARKWVVPQLADLVPQGVRVRHVSRQERSSPAEGYPAAHQAAQKRIVAETLE